MRKQKGFSLIELLIVVAIILIIAAIAIPNLLRARIAAQESSAVASVRTLNTAEITFQTGNPAIGYTTLSVLGGAAPCVPTVGVSACLIDNTLALGAKSGYLFAATPGTSAGSTTANLVTVSAVPQSYNQSGVRSFCANEDAVIKSATIAAPALVIVNPCPAAYSVLR